MHTELERPRELAALREQVALACRVLAGTGLAEHVLGHVSVRVDPGRLLVRCRGPRERGLAHTTAQDVHLVDLDPAGADPDVEPAGGPSGVDGAGPPPGWAVPNELPIHTGILRARPEVTAVVHCHPPAVVAASLAGLPWLPLVGAYDIPAARLAADGIPVWPRSVLVRRDDLATQMLAAMGDRPVVVLRGHGLVCVAGDDTGGDPATAVAAAVVRSVAVDSLARMMLAVAGTGAPLRPVPNADLAELPDLGDGFNVATRWRQLCTRTESAGGDGERRRHDRVTN